MNPIIAFIKLIRFPNILLIVFTQYAIRLGVIYPIIYNFSGSQEIEHVGLKMTALDFFLLCLSTVLIAAAGYIINDYFDIKVDRINKPDRIIVGKFIKRRVVMGAHVVMNAIALLIAAYLANKLGNWNLVLIHILSAGALGYYSTIFKKQVLVGNVVVALLAALVPFIAGLYELILQHAASDDTVNSLLFRLEAYTPFEEVEYLLIQVFSNMMSWIIGISIFAFITTLIREIIKDIEDHEGDEKCAYKTLPVVYGKAKAKLLAQGLIVVMIAMIGYFQYLQMSENPGGEVAELAKAQTRALITVMYLLFTVQIPLIYVLYKLKLANLKADYHQLSTSMKMIMLTGIGYTVLFYYLIIKL
jgi:4-hydroxybenzoate polyprenyltransferase